MSNEPGAKGSAEAMPMIRLDPADRDDLLRVDRTAFGWGAVERDPVQDTAHLEWDRTWGALRPAVTPSLREPNPHWPADQDLAGIYSVYSLTMSLPGAGREPVQRPVAGLTWVGVHPDHRRRGVATTMLRHHLHGLHDDGAEPVSALWASEAAIYQRFGYGEAISALNPVIPRGAALRPGPAGWADVSTQLHGFELDQHLELIQRLQTASAATRSGLVVRPAAMTSRRLTDRPLSRLGTEPWQLVLASRAGEPTGYALLQRRIDWEGAHSHGRVTVDEVYAVDAASAYALWARLLDLDLTDEIVTPTLALDDPLLLWLVDARTPRSVLWDGVWIRLVDLDRALADRGYPGDAVVVLEVTDEFCPWNAGRWRFEARDGEGRVTRSDADADLTVSIRELGAAYLGGHSLAAAGAGGLVVEHTPGALVAASTALRGAVEPTPPMVF